jgi:hypothetical protein
VAARQGGRHEEEGMPAREHRGIGLEWPQYLNSIQPRQQPIEQGHQGLCARAELLQAGHPIGGFHDGEALFLTARNGAIRATPCHPRQ